MDATGRTFADGPDGPGGGRLALRFWAAAACLGAIAFFASEVFFWTLPHEDFSLRDQALTCVVYIVAASIALYAVVRAGLQGMPAAFIGGAILGFLVEGAIVSTMYDAFPFQLVWTPLAWHALISGGLVLGLARAGLRPWQAGLAWLALGLFGAAFAQYWPREMKLPGQGAVMAYLLGFGLLVPLAHAGLDRIARVRTPPVWAVVPPGLILILFWGVQGAFDMNPLRLVLLPVLSGLVWLALALGDRRPLDLPPAGAMARHLPFLVAPLTVALLAPLGWAVQPQGIDTWPLAILTCAVSLGWLGRLVWRARS